MSYALAAGGRVEDEPPHAARHRSPWRRLGLLLAVFSALALGITFMTASQPAYAVSSIDGQWTVSHGGTGQLMLRADGSYTSTCQVTPGYADAWCPAPAGTFRYSTMGTASVTFSGTDGSSTSYRVSGSVYSPDTITSLFGSRTMSPLVMKKGAEHTCTNWSGSSLGLLGTPMVHLDAAGSNIYATGSDQLISPATQNVSVNLAETASNYFQIGQCDTFAPPVHVTMSDTSTQRSDGTWVPKVVITVTDQSGAPMTDLYVTGRFTDTIPDFFSVHSMNGTFTLTDFTQTDAVSTIVYTAQSINKEAGAFPIAEGDSMQITLNNPHTATPTPTPTATPTPTPTLAPAPATHHIGDLDNATASLSSAISLKTSRARNWQPRVAATVVDSTGAAVAGATVTGTFSNHKGTLTCVTAANGICTLGDFTLSRYTSSTVFTVTNVVKSSSTYVVKANSDPDGDSTGTSITLKRP